MLGPASTMGELLRASHVKPWRECTDKERLDPHNGLLLGAHLDALFDKGLITFDDNGSMLVSVKISDRDREELRLGRRLRKAVSDALKGYLTYHRESALRRGDMTYKYRD
jgi:predicted restriction endonuclease